MCGYIDAVTVRALLALLALMLTLPAMAAPACAPVSMAGMHHSQPMQDHAPESKAASHLCVGCVPVADWLRERFTAPVPIDGGTPDPVPVRLTLGKDTPPVLRPPRDV